MLLITGANGHLGRLIVEEMLRRRPDADFAVSVRDPQRAQDLADRGVQVRRADYDAPESLRDAFTGIDRLLLMPTATPDPGQRAAQHRVAVQSAVAAGVGHIVYLSVNHADRFDTPLLAAHYDTEVAIGESGAQWTILRNAIYAEYLAADVTTAVRVGELAAPAASAAVAPVLRRDLAVATAVVLIGGGHEQRIYELTAPDTVNWEQLAKLASAEAGKPISYRPITDVEATAQALSSGIPEQYLDTVVGFYSAYRRGWCTAPSADFQELTGRPATVALNAVKAVVSGIAS
jgi:NAD(P)H dehydrogenase (quinone)